MRVLIITEVDIETGEYEVTFRNKSSPGEPMDLNLIKAAWKKVSADFLDGKSESGPKEYLA